MNETVRLLLAGLAGGGLGTIFFGGLWWTVEKGLRAQDPARWFLLSLLLRMGITLTGFFFVAAGDWKRLLLCLLGFVTVRIIITRCTRGNARPISLTARTEHAP